MRQSELGVTGKVFACLKQVFWGAKHKLKNQNQD